VTIKLVYFARVHASVGHFCAATMETKFNGTRKNSSTARLSRICTIFLHFSKLLLLTTPNPLTTIFLSSSFTTFTKDDSIVAYYIQCIPFLPQSNTGRHGIGTELHTTCSLVHRCSCICDQACKNRACGHILHPIT